MLHPRRARPRHLLATLCLIVTALPAAAVDLSWPDGATMVQRSAPGPSDFRIATGPFADGTVPVTPLEGALSEQVWQIPEASGATLQIRDLIVTQLEEAGFDILFTCADTACGGFDFRYAMPIAEGPAMHVDLGDFHYLSARRMTEDGAVHVAATVSRGGALTYVHLATVSPLDALPADVTPSSRLPTDLEGSDILIATLLTEGRVVLEDLNFETGASALSRAEYPSLMALGALLSEDPSLDIVLVGHTDTEGSLDGNIALSRARATAVRSFLLETFDVDPTRIEAEGIGFLAPRAPNASAEGREANRRVEVVLTSAD